MIPLWSSPSICHSAIGFYHNGQGGWRGAYSFVDIGRNDWIKSNAKEYMKNQEADGRIWAYPTKDGRYNMNVVFVDILLQYYGTGHVTTFSLKMRAAII